MHNKVGRNDHEDITWIHGCCRAGSSESSLSICLGCDDQAAPNLTGLIQRAAGGGRVLRSQLSQLPSILPRPSGIHHELTQPVILIVADVRERVRTGKRQIAVGVQAHRDARCVGR